MAERLWEIPQQRTVLPDLLGEQPEVVGMYQHPVYQTNRTVDLVGKCKCLRQPEGAQQERALVSLEPISGEIPHHQPTLVEQPTLHRVDGRQDLGVSRFEKTANRDEEYGCVQFVSSERLRESADLLVPPLLEYRGTNSLRLIAPLGGALGGIEVEWPTRQRGRGRPSKEALDERKCLGSSRTSQIP